MKNKFWGCNIAIILGFVGLAGALGQISSGNTQADPNVFIFMIIGGFAYKSLKKRKLGLVKNSILRRVLEPIALILIFLMVVLQNNFIQRLLQDPVPNGFIPIWIYGAYFNVLFKKQDHKA